MIPILFEKYERDFASNGIGRLSDATSCVVTERLNNIYVLDLRYSVNGKHANEIKPGRIILAKPNDSDSAQPFRIYEVSRTFNGIDVRANHISYDLNYYPMRGYTAHTCAGAVAALSARAIIQPGFHFSTDIVATADWITNGAAPIRTRMGGDNGITSVYGGEWYFNQHSCVLKERRGTDTGVTLRYGVNMTGIEAISDDMEDYTGAFAFYLTDSSYVSSNIQYLDQNAVPQKILIVDHTSDFDSAPTTAQLDVVAQSDLMLSAGMQESINVSFTPTIEHLSIGDFVTVIYDKYDIHTKLEVVQTEYNVLIDRYNTIELGAIRPTLADIIASLK